MNVLDDQLARNELEAAIEDLYRVFAVPVPPVIEGCPCCIDTRGVDVLLTTPLRGLSGGHLWRYVTGAFLTVGGERDFRYLLPRIFELAAIAQYELPDCEIVLSKLARAEWQNWRDVERTAIERFIHAWLGYALEEDLKNIADGWGGERTESVLCGAAHARMPLAGLLLRLDEPRNKPVLAELILRFPDNMSVFWDNVPEGLIEIAPKLVKGTA